MSDITMNGAQPQQPSYSFSFTVNEWMVIRAGLYELPGKIGIPIIGKLEQAIMQAQAAQAVTEEPRKGIVQ